MRLILLSITICLILFCAVFAQDDMQKLIAAGDSLFAIFDNKGALEQYAAVVEEDSLNYEANWKAARAFVDVGETLEDDPRAEYYQKGAAHARRATRINPDGSKGHLFLSIALGRVALDAGAKERIRLSKEIKMEVDLAIGYDPDDDIAHHVLGRWHRKLANLSWIEKGFANIFLGGVPKEASNEKAAECFQRAIEIKPTHINHHLELGMTYEMMDMPEKAREEFQKCLDLPKSDSDDDKYKTEAKEYLENL